MENKNEKVSRSLKTSPPPNLRLSFHIGCYIGDTLNLSINIICDPTTCHSSSLFKPKVPKYSYNQFNLERLSKLRQSKFLSEDFSAFPPSFKSL